MVVRTTGLRSAGRAVLVCGVLAVSLASCSSTGGAPSPSGTPSSPATTTTVSPTSAPEVVARAVVVSGTPANPHVSWLTLTRHVDADARVSGLAGRGGVIDGTAYVFEQTAEGTIAVALDAAGTVSRLSVVPVNTSTLATRSSPPMLAWAVDASASSRVEISPPTGRHGTVLLTESLSINSDHAYVVARWSSVGTRLFVGQDPTGLGGYPVYFGTGVSSLSAVDVASRHVTSLLPYPPHNAMLCYDDMTTDDRTVVDTCTARTITVRTLATGAVQLIRLPSNTSAYRYVRAARFSPDGTRVAFALNVGDPDHERGAVAVSGGLGGTSHLLVTLPNDGVVVDGWLDADTLLIETDQETRCTGSCGTRTWTLDIGTGRLTLLTEGRVVALDVR